MGDGVQGVATFGGFTKLEAAAVRIVGHTTGWPAEHQNLEAMARLSVDLAQAVLDECKRRQAQAAEAGA
jgi:hypothetical protein